MSEAARFSFDLPAGREADRPPEERGLPRDGVRLLISSVDAEQDRHFRDLAQILRPGDLLVVNESATLPASLPARGRPGEFVLHLSTPYGPRLWVAEPRWGPGRPGPLALEEGETIEAAGVAARWIAPYPGIPRLGFVQFDRDPSQAIADRGRPIRYGYVPREYPLDVYQTVFSRTPGSAEMPSAGRPFSVGLVQALRARGVGLATILLHAGVSSLEVPPGASASSILYPEPFEVPPETVGAISRARRRGRRVVAVGTTVARALESALDGTCLRAAKGFTRLYLSETRPPTTFDGILTGFHTSSSTHLALLASFAGERRLERAYRAAIAREYLWHEFGDSHLLWREETPRGAR